MKGEKKEKQKKGQYEDYIIQLSSKDKIMVKMWRNDGKVVKFSVTYLFKFKNRWLEIRRCDNSHPDMVAHCHYFRYNKKVDWRPLLGDDSAELLTKTIDNFKKHYKIFLISYFKQS